MKYRAGFISNSSTSSFLMYGVYLDERPYENGEDEEWEADDKFDDEAGGYGFSVHRPDYGPLYIGASWDSVSDDETGKQFKDRVAKDMKAFLAKYGYKEAIECETLEGTYAS